jgi:hypothetical protein
MGTISHQPHQLPSVSHPSAERRPVSLQANAGMHGELRRHLAVNEAEKAGKLLTAMPRIAPADHVAAGDIEGREQTGDPVAFVVMSPSLGMPERPGVSAH